jgi:hypothetical protein
MMCGKHIVLNCIEKVWAVLMDAECASVLCAQTVMSMPSTRLAASTSARRAYVWLLAVSVFASNTPNGVNIVLHSDVPCGRCRRLCEGGGGIDE